MQLLIKHCTTFMRISTLQKTCEYATKHFIPAGHYCLLRDRCENCLLFTTRCYTIDQSFSYLLRKTKY